MKFLALLIISALAFSACATTKPVPTAATLAKVPVTVAAVTVPPAKPKSNLTGMVVGVDAPIGWEIAKDTSVDSDDGSAGAYQHIPTGSVMLFFADQTPSATLEDIKSNIVMKGLGPRGRIITATGGTGPNLWVKWSGKTRAGVDISGKILIKRLDPPYDDVIVTVAGTWADADAGLEPEFDAIAATVRIEQVNHPDVPTQRF